MLPKSTLIGSRVYVDPSYAPSEIVPHLHTLPLLVDNVVVCDPTSANLREWKYPHDRFWALVKQNVYTPLFTKSSKRINDRGLTRRDLIPDSSFVADYENAIEDDLHDDEFLARADKCNIDHREAAFSLNWDLLISQRLKSGMLLLSRNLRGLFLYKIQKTGRTISHFTEAEREAVNIVRFGCRIGLRSASSLPVDELIKLRKEKTAQHFRNWFGSTLGDAIAMRKITGIRPDQTLVDSYNELLNQHTQKANKVAAVSGIIVAGLAGIATGGYAAIPVGTAAELAFPRIMRFIWKKIGASNWVFLLADLKDKPR